MKKNTRFVGLDVHAETIAVAVADSRGETRSLGIIPNRLESIRRVLGKLGKKENLRVCYEAGPCGYVLYWQLAELGIACEVIAPTLIPVKAGDRVKTDRRDARRLADCYRVGVLTAVWVPNAEHEALRGLVRAREAAKKDELRARHRLSKFFLLRGRRPPTATKSWSQPYMHWARSLRFEHAANEATYRDYLNEVEHANERIIRLEKEIDKVIEEAPDEIKELIAALQCLKGIRKISATTIVAELGDITRFGKPTQLMGYSGVVPREHSSGSKIRRSGITKTGNAHLRRILFEAAWCNRSRPSRSYTQKKREEGLSEQVKAIAWKAQNRLYARYTRLLGRGKAKNQVITAMARELLGFIWAIATERKRPPTMRKAA